MTNTINVPRELLENIVLCYNEGEFELGTLAAECHALLSAPSLAGVDGLDTDRNAAFKACPESGCDWGSFYLGWKARGEVEQAIIDGLRGEVDEWALRSQYNADTAQDVASERDQQAQRIGELEAFVAERAGVKPAGEVPAGSILVGKAELAMVRSALMRDSEGGRPVRCEMLKNLDDSIAKFDRIVAALQSRAFVMPDAFGRAFITGESCDGVYRVVIKSETLKEMQSVHNWIARLNGKGGV